jgi:hypothetical protein
MQQKNKNNNNNNNKKLGNTVLLVLVMHLDVWRSMARKHLVEEGLFPTSMKADDLFPPAQITTARNKAKALKKPFSTTTTTTTLLLLLSNPSSAMEQP